MDRPRGHIRVEGVLAPVLTHDWDGWRASVEGEFYFNQPFDRNVLVDTPERASYAANFDVETFEISKLFLSVERGDLLLGIGKMATPFGHTHFPLFTNARLDAPFIRTESILWRETGALLRYTPGALTADVALTNGSEDRDTKLVEGPGRPARRRPTLLGRRRFHENSGRHRFGGQKEFRNHVGADCFVRRGRWCLSGEVIDDEYGFRKPGFDPLDIFWRRSLYYRDRNLATDRPISGLGYYINLGYTADHWEVWLNYGEYYHSSWATLATTSRTVAASSSWTTG